MLPILTMQNIDSHESFFKNSFFSVSSSIDATIYNDNIRMLSIGVIVFNNEVEVREIIESKLSQFVRTNNLDNGTDFDSFVFELSKFGFMIHHCAIDLNFELELINDFFVNLIDELNLVFA